RDSQCDPLHLSVLIMLCLIGAFVFYFIDLPRDSNALWCDPGWDGDLCDHCVPMPGCVHGSCEQPWQCTCDPGWGGHLNVCLQQQPCQNGATCVMQDSGDFTCLCPKGFHGPSCQQRTGPCHQRRSLCKNGGLCEDADGFAVEVTCRCLAGFTGLRCETNIDDCLMKPCANSATCIDGINRFSCVCPAGFSGRFCTVNLDDCDSQPCLNGGRCLDRAGGFRCICRPGFTGATCEAPPPSSNTRKPGWTTVGWEGGGGGQSQRITTSSGGRNTSHSDNLLKVTVSERSGAGLSEVQLIIILVLAGVTLTVVVLTTTLVLQGHHRNCGHTPCCHQRAQRVEEEGQISFLSAAEPEKKKLNTEVTLHVPQGQA
uniref:Delta-like 2 homolog (Drosophila) n=1 Tax=Amphilophus citrinellus TaxID=61819 RepID=A0A3Q0R3Z7_AMPCI